MIPLSFYHSSVASLTSGAVAASRSSILADTRKIPIKPWDVKQDGGQRDSGWGTGEKLISPFSIVLKWSKATCFDKLSLPETKAHSRDPRPTPLDPNDPKSKQTYVPTSETFEEYMKRHNLQSVKGESSGTQTIQPVGKSGSSRSRVSDVKQSVSKDYTIKYVDQKDYTV